MQNMHKYVLFQKYAKLNLVFSNLVFPFHKQIYNSPKIIYDLYKKTCKCK